MRQPLSETSKGVAPDPSDLELRIEIQGENARVFLKDGDRWIEAMPRKFALVPAMTNAALLGVDARGPGVGSWIEIWSILLTAVDDNQLLAEWSRAVNNLVPSATAVPAFTMAATGVLRRVAASE